ncbi:prolyl-tRNA editing enzyme YbaK/EbsC (Cys-tRNA(Pro) deacylase) [Thermocatellispora tengchongensis]|uniref:Prolyl-tRNA editing enzyme YbaK/EbsC (Cys-tRNA(Pro) deacylase) n=1 Tax=Thermocatellispora tengchongensis TaxID=1073253 RepID=A0A840NWC0_9ACTN|nr:YbaK/EbsC family protein [Thermocatellispora tengchongensis]MBB5130476.1 prolyl-tRNA editing enzyme YbaK/EbsC (Cys-tRNA(Pro) deacylase) [Thermocatellispora tengchongensis]
MKDALAIHRWLLAHQVHHEIVRLPRALTSARELPDVLGADPADCLEVTVFEVDTRVGLEPVAVLSSVAAPPSPGIVGAILGARKVRPAPAFLVNAATEYADGLVCPLLLPETLALLIDERLYVGQEEHAGQGGARLFRTPTGERHTALSIRAADLLSLVSGKRLDLAPRRPLPVAGVPRQAHPRAVRRP